MPIHWPDLTFPPINLWNAASMGIGSAQNKQKIKTGKHMPYELFEDQEEFVTGLRRSLSKGNRSILGVASPAFGKTVVAGYITQSASDKGKAVWFLVHRKNLLRQTSKSFWGAGIQHGLITSGKSRSRLPVQVGTIGTVYARMNKQELEPPAILFIDEAHLSQGNMFSTVIKWCIDSGTIVIGLTGTPQRLDGKSLGDLFQDMIEARSTSWLIQQGRLSDYEIYTTNVQPDLSNVRKSGGDLNREDLAEVMAEKAIVGDAVSHYQRYANGLRAVCYCVNVKHSKLTAQAFNDAGIPAVHVDADTTEKELKDACEGLADRRYLVLCNCELVIEGFDLSSQIGRDITLEACILLRPTESLARYLQMVFRALRKKPNPAIILDHAGCAIKHGLPDDDRQWSLAGADKKSRKKKKDDDEETAAVQWCKACYRVFRVGPDRCPECGAVIEKQERKIKHIEGELQKIDPEELRRQREARIERARANDLESLVATGMKPKQAQHVLAARAEKNSLRNELADLVKQYRQKGRDPIQDLGISVSDIKPMKPKQLRQSIETIREAMTGE